MRVFVRLSAILLLFAGSAAGLCAQTNIQIAAQSGESPSHAGTEQTPPPDSRRAVSQAAPEVAEAEALIPKADWNAAEAKLSTYLASHPSDARALFDAGYVADAQNKTEDAVAFYSRAVKADPNNFESHLSLGLLLARVGKLDRARPEISAATQLDPGDAGPAVKARAWRALAQIDRRDNPSQASGDLLEALKLSPETTSDTLLAAELADASNQPESAEAAYRRVLAKDPRNAEATAGLGHLLIAEKKYPDAESFLREALRQAPEDPTLTAQLATVLAAEDKGEALPLLQKLHASRPDDENVTRMLAEVLAEAGEAAEADQLDSALLAAHPRDAGLLIAHGQNLVRQLRYADAFQAFEQASGIAPGDGDAWSGLAFTASKTKQPSVALHALSMRSKFLPENASTYFLWATSYDTLHDRVAAISYYHHFLEAAAGKFPDQEWQARQRLLVLEKKQ
ncbi:tetratricopeptide repeat protein [Acidobacteria bacterium AB60]|nr:tetratricopeptide repeat protein [Acidobacteria bacterium AB60]